MISFNSTELLIDLGTREPYKECIDFYQKKTRLTKVV